MNKIWFIIIFVVQGYYIYADEVVNCTVSTKMDHCIQTLLGKEAGDSRNQADTLRIVSDKDGLFTTDEKYDYKKVMWCEYIMRKEAKQMRKQAKNKTKNKKQKTKKRTAGAR